MRLGYFGGTFDPPHRGHLAVATAALHRFALDEVFLAPTGRQPLKAEPPAASFADRMAMTRLLCVCTDRLRVIDVDKPQPDGRQNYTIDALHQLLRHGDEISIIVGADSFLSLRKWKQPDELLRLAEWIVISRPGFPLDDLSSLALTSAQRDRVHLWNDVQVDTSSSAIRQRLRSGDPVPEMLTPEVFAYIARHGLYSYPVVR